MNYNYRINDKFLPDNFTNLIKNEMSIYLMIINLKYQ